VNCTKNNEEKLVGDGEEMQETRSLKHLYTDESK
jgi:hypothetical protein